MGKRTFSIKELDDSKSESLNLRCDTLGANDVFELIATSDIKVIGQLSNSSNAALLGEINNGNDEIISVVIKPASFENPLIDFEWGTLIKREVAAFELSQLLGWDIVPPTVLRDVQDLLSSVQTFIPHDPREHYFNQKLSDRSIYEKFVLFDYIANNADRKAGHLLHEKNESFEFSVNSKSEVEFDTTGKIYGIDHGLTFHEDDKLRTVIWEFAEQPISLDLLDDLVKTNERIGEVLSNYLTYSEIKATQLRIEKILINPFHRALDANSQAFPWPLV